MNNMKEMETKELKRDDYNNLEELFKEWKEAHLEDVDDGTVKKTFPKGTTHDFKNSFCFDGYIGENKKGNILFVCRESNVAGQAETNDTFWIKQIVKDEKTKYFACINSIAKEFNESIFDCAYININKRGGISNCLKSRLRNYSILYKNYILKEIELIKPEIIVVLGKMPDEIIKLVKESQKPIYQYPFHPCVYRRSEISKIKENKVYPM